MRETGGRVKRNSVVEAVNKNRGGKTQERAVALQENNGLRY